MGLSAAQVPDDMMYQFMAIGTGVSADWNKSLVTFVGGTIAADHVQLDTVVEDLSLNFGADCAD